MFKRKKKPNTENMQERDLTLEIRQIKLRGRVTQLEQRIEQLECKHNFVFSYYLVIGIFRTNYVHYKCTYCGKTIAKQWDNVAKTGQQALKLLNLVPKDWKIKGDK